MKFLIRECDNVTVYFIDFPADEFFGKRVESGEELFARKCIAYVKKSAPVSHREHILAVYVAPAGYGEFGTSNLNLFYEVMLDSGVGIPRRFVEELKPYRQPTGGGGFDETATAGRA